MKVFVTDRNGREHALEALEGWRVMEVIRDWGLPVAAECGGAGICGTCHVRVDKAWADRLVPPNEDELHALDHLDGADEGSRLSCQILMSEALDGLRVSLAGEAQAGDELEEAEAVAA